MTLQPEDAVLFYASWEDMLFGVPTPIIVCAVLFPEYADDVEHPDRLMLNTLTGEIEQAFRRN